MALAVPDLRPLSIGQLLDRGIRLYRRHFLTYIGIVAVAQIPVTVVTIAATLAFPAPGSLDLDPTASLSEAFISGLTQSTGGPAGILGLVVFLFAIILSLLGSAAMTAAAARHYLGFEATIVSAFRTVASYWARLLGSYILVAGLGIGIILWWFLVPFLGWFTGFGIFIFYSIVIVPFVMPGIVVEDQTARQVIQRAWELARRRFWWLLGFMLILGLFGQIIVTGPALLFGTLLTFSSGVDEATASIIQQVLSLLLNLIYLPLQLTCVTLLYFDVRVRTEGLDLSLQTLAEADGTSLTPEAVTAVLRQVPASQSGFLPNWTEMAYFFGITVGLGGFCLAVYLVLVAILSAFLLSGISG